MKHMRPWVAIGAFSLLAAVALSALPRAKESGDSGFHGGSYLTTIKDAGGNLSSRSVITLHADHTMLAVDSGQQGPTYYFSNQVGMWKPAGNHQIAARVIDFQFPLNLGGPGMARADYVISLAPGRRQMTGTITVRTFSLQDGNPLHDEGILVGTFAFEGEWIRP